MSTENGTQTDFAGEAWDNFRQEGFADVKAAAEHALEKAKVYLSRIDDFEEKTTIRQLKGKARVMKRRHAGLELLLAHMIAHGPSDVPPWGEVSDKKKREIGELESYIADSTLQRAERDLRIDEEFEVRRQKGEGAGAIITDLSDRFNLSETKVEDVVYPRND